MCGALSISTPLPPAASSVQNTSTIKPPPAKQHRNSKKKIEIALRARTQFQVDFRFAFNCWVLFRDVCQLLSIYWLAHTVRSRYRVEKRKKRKGFVFLCSAQYTDDPPSLRYNNRKKNKDSKSFYSIGYQWMYLTQLWVCAVCVCICHSIVIIIACDGRDRREI